jgi:hypothetical protein
LDVANLGDVCSVGEIQSAGPSDCTRRQQREVTIAISAKGEDSPRVRRRRYLKIFPPQRTTTQVCLPPPTV